MGDRPQAPGQGTARAQRSAVRTAVVWEALRSVLAERTVATSRAVLDVIDVGGGTGGLAVPIGELGHRVIVVEPSPDALAALERRVADAGVAGLVAGVQGDTRTLTDIVGPAGADVVLCHGVLEYVDEPAVALAAITTCLRDGGVLSVVVANRNAAVLARALSGRFGEARRAISDPDGRFGDHDPLPRRFTADELGKLIMNAGLAVGPIHGVRVFSDLVPGGFVDAEPGAVNALLDLEKAASTRPAFQAIAAHLHVLASR